MNTTDFSFGTAWVTTRLVGEQASLGFFQPRAIPSSVAALCSETITHKPRGRGLVLPVMTFIHAWFSMTQSAVRKTSSAGLWIATAALLLLLLPALVGFVTAAERNRLSRSASRHGNRNRRVGRHSRGFESMIGKEREMKCSISAVLICCAVTTALTAKRTDFSGTWIFNPEKSQNIGMMSDMKMTQTIAQSSNSLDVVSDTTFQNNNQQMKTHYDLAGKAVTNDSPMAGASETVTKWEGDKLVTTWTSKGAVQGTKTVRTETRSLSPDGKTMTVESVRGSNQPVVMVFEKK